MFLSARTILTTLAQKIKCFFEIFLVFTIYLQLTRAEDGTWTIVPHMKKTGDEKTFEKNKNFEKNG